jgi:HK97 family phage portal protein
MPFANAYAIDLPTKGEVKGKTMFERLFPRRFGARAKTHAPETKSATRPMIALSLNGEARWTPRDYAGLAREGVMQNAIAYRCVRMIAEGAASVPWLLYDGDTELTDHPLLALLTHPNPEESTAAFFERWYAFLQCAGNAYLEAVSLRGLPRALYVLRPDRVKIVPGPRGWPAAYDYTVDGRTMRIGRESETNFLPVLHATLFHPLDDHYGLSPIEAAAKAVDVHNAGAAWTKALLDNAARPSGALIYHGPDGQALTEEQFTRLKNERESSYQGAGNAGRPMVLEGGLEWRAMSHAPSDMGFSDLRDAAAREIALAFGVPQLLLGFPVDNTYANYREANLAFWRQTVLPLVARTAQSLSLWLGPRFGEGLRIGYDADAVTALSTERESMWNRLNDAAFLTLNERRAAAGYSPMEGGDTLT